MSELTLFIMSLVISFLLFIVLWFLKYKIQSKFKKLSSVLYPSFKNLLTLLTALNLSQLFDIHRSIAFVPEKSMSISMAIYTVIITIIFQVIEVVLDDQITNISCEIYVKRVNDSEKSMDSLIVKKSKNLPKDKIYIYVKYDGNIKKIKNLKLKVKVPYSLTAQIGQTIFLDSNNYLNINLSKYIKSDHDDIEIEVSILYTPGDGNNKNTKIIPEIETRNIFINKKLVPLACEIKE